MEKGPLINISGKISQKDEGAILKRQKGYIFENHLANMPDELRKVLEDNEVEKTEEEIDTIDLANSETNNILENFGIGGYDIPARNYHLIPREIIEKVDKQDSPAVTNYRFKYMLIDKDLYRHDSLIFALVVFHETLHLKSYFKLKAKIVETAEMKNVDLWTLREGVDIYPSERNKREGMGSYFFGLHEAIVATEEKNFLKKILETEKFRKYKEKLEAAEGQAALMAVEKEHGIPTDEIYDFELDSKRFASIGRDSHQKVLEYLCAEIAQHKKVNPEKIYEEFLKSQVTGRIVSLAKLIEGTFGKDSFRKLGEMGGDKESAEKTLVELKKRRDNKIA